MNPTDLDHQGYCIRPPSEAYSILLQATLGCSHNKCTFCSAYKGKRFAIKNQAILERDLTFAERYCRRQNRVFVMDGDAMIMPMRHWEWLLTNIARRLPWVDRVSTYANAKGVAMKTDEELTRLRKLGLSLAYYGVESGHPEILAKINKGADPEKLLLQARRLKDAGFSLSVTVIVGIAGKEKGFEHARMTGELISRMDPDYVGALTLMLPENTPLALEAAKGDFVLSDPAELLAELGILFANTNLSCGLFTSNHASNYLPIKAHLPEDKEETMRLINFALQGGVRLRDEWTRGL